MGSRIVIYVGGPYDGDDTQDDVYPGSTRMIPNYETHCYVYDGKGNYVWTERPTGKKK